MQEDAHPLSLIYQQPELSVETKFISNQSSSFMKIKNHKGTTFNSSYLLKTPFYLQISQVGAISRQGKTLSTFEEQKSANK